MRSEISRRKELMKGAAGLGFKHASGDFVEAVEEVTGEPLPPGDFCDKNVIMRKWRSISPNLYWMTARLFSMAVPDMSLTAIVAFANDRHLSNDDVQQFCNQLLLAANKVSMLLCFI